MAAPVFNGLDNNPTFNENGAPVVLDDNATISDADVAPSDPFTGATLTLSRAGGANPDDVLSASDAVYGPMLSDGQIQITETQIDPDTHQPTQVTVVIGSY